MSKDIIQSLKDIMTIKGIQRVLTSGGESTCLEGLETLAKLVDVANDKIIIMPGGGITIKNIQRIINGCNAKEFHISGRSIFDSKMDFRNTSCMYFKDHSFLIITNKTLSDKFTYIYKFTNTK